MNVPRGRARLSGVAAILLLLAGCATSGTSGLSVSERSDAARVAGYLNRATSLQGRFTQTGPQAGSESAGRFVYAPGALRLDYDEPHVMHLKAGGKKIVLEDEANGSVTRLSLARNPLGLLLRTPVSFDAPVKVTSVRRFQGVLQLSAAEADNPSQGLLTLQFADDGQALRLIGLDGVDARAHHIVLRFYDLADGAPGSAGQPSRR